MPTEKPKVSAYIPQVLYDRFKEFQEGQELSMSEAVAVVFAEYFGMQETIKRSTEESTIGGVTLDRVEAIEKQLLELTQKVDRLNSTGVTTSEAVNSSFSSTPMSTSNSSKSLVKGIYSSDPLFVLPSEPLKKLEPVMGKYLSKRLGISAPKLSAQKKKSDFASWSRGQDPDGIAWQSVDGGYLPADELTDQEIAKLLKWVEDNP